MKYLVMGFIILPCLAFGYMTGYTKGYGEGINNGYNTAMTLIEKGK